jgi:hypothetical protein
MQHVGAGCWGVRGWGFSPLLQYIREEVSKAICHPLSPPRALSPDYSEMARSVVALAALALIAAACVPRGNALTWHACNDVGSSPIAVRSLEMEPDPPAHGSLMAFSVEGDADLQSEVRMPHRRHRSATARPAIPRADLHLMRSTLWGRAATRPAVQ